MKRLLWLGCLSYTLIGFAHVAVGSVLTIMLDHYKLGYDQGGLLIFMQFFGFMIGVLTTPWWTGKLSRRGALMLALGCLTVAELIYTSLPPWQVILCFAPVAGFGFGMIEAVLGAMVIEAAPADSKATPFARLEVFFGVGALLMPLIAGAFIWLGAWRISFVVVAGLAVITAILWRLIPLGDRLQDVLLAKSQPGSSHSAAQMKLGRTGIIITVVFVIIFFIYVGVEMSLANFLPSMMVESFSTSDATASMSVTCLWIAMTIGRVIAGPLAERIRYAKYLFIHIISAVLFLVLLVSVNQLWGMFLSIVLLGLALSGLFAILLIFANAVLPGRTERMTSLLIASGGVGGALLPLMSGWIMDHATVTMTLATLLGLVLLMLALLTIVIQLDRRKEAALNEV